MSFSDWRENPLFDFLAKVQRPAAGSRSPYLGSLFALTAVALGGCQSLPINAPTSRNIVKASTGPQNTLNYSIVELDAAVAATIPPRNETGLVRMAAFANTSVPPRSDMVVAGDELVISVYEAGVSLFGGAGAISAASVAAGAGTSAAHNITASVREDGSITLPYIGRMEAGGSYPEDLAERIRARLSQYSQSPQVQVAIDASVNNTAYISGTVVKSGRYRLTSAHERLLDMIALAGGIAIDVNDAELYFTRGDVSTTLRLADLRAEDQANIQIRPGDRIEIRKERKSITVFGATDKVSEVPFDAMRLTLAQAIARSTGPADSRADARGVYLFRLEKSADGEAARPVIYHIDMMNPQTYFVAQMFQMQDKDVILYANSPSNLTQKFVSLVNMLFSPALGVRFATQ